MTSRSSAAEKIIVDPLPSKRISTRVAAIGRAKSAPLAGNLTVIVPLAGGDAVFEKLKAELELIDGEIKSKKGELLRGVKHLHVARWVLLPARVRGLGKEIEPSLAMWTVFDGDRYDLVFELVASARPLLDRIYQHCRDYPGPRAPARDVEDYLLLHKSASRVAAYDGTPGRSTEIIEAQENLATELATFVRDAKNRGLPNKYVFLEAQRFVDDDLFGRRRDLAEFARKRFTLEKCSVVVDLALEIVRTILGAGTRATLLLVSFLLAVEYCAFVLGKELGERFLLTWPQTFGTVIGLMLLMPAAVGALTVALWILALRRVEAREALSWVPVPDLDFRAHHERLKERDNEESGMNRMTILTDVKPGLFRRITCHTVLGAIALRARRNHDGVLDGVETIHFAQWRFVDRGKRLLFMSNYDGDALQYFQDFSNNAAPGINAIWGNTEGFPPTENFVGGGARNLEEFRNAARVHQIPTDVWYFGYTDRRYATCRINDNWLIHACLNSFPTPRQVDHWVTTLELRAGLPSP